MFHAKDGWYFERLESGSVRIVKQVEPSTQEFGQPPYSADLTLDQYAWASIISSMSAAGEADGGYYRALDFHNGLEEVPEPEASDYMKSLDNLKMHTDLGTMLDEIICYTEKHPGEIRSADLPTQLKLGFVHDDGTYWAIKISDVKNSMHKMQESSDEKEIARADILKRTFSNAEGKKNLCAILSGKK